MSFSQIKNLLLLAFLLLLQIHAAEQIQLQTEETPVLPAEPILNSSTSQSFSFGWIVLIALGVSNITLLLIIWCVSKKYKVQPHFVRERFNEVSPNLMFKTLTNKTISQQELFESRICYHLGERLCEAPCYIIHQYFQAFAPLDTSKVVLKPCERCLGVTNTIMIQKFGKRQCKINLMTVILLLYPLVLIYGLLVNHRVWKKYFCGNCGLEKAIQPK